MLSNAKRIKYFGLVVVLFLFTFFIVICVQYRSDSFYSEVFVRFAQGDIRKISPNLAGKYYEANIHPEGTMAVYFGNAEGPPQIWLTDFEAFRPTTLTPKTYASRHPAFSADGNRIVFVSDRGLSGAPDCVEDMKIGGAPSDRVSTHIYTMNIDGSNIKQITFGPYRDQRPAFSPDGNIIAFVSNRKGDNRLWYVDTQKQNDKPKAILSNIYGYRPNFSSNGKWLYFFTNVSGRHQICRTRVGVYDGFSCMKNDDKGLSHGPFASPSGEYLLMHSTRGGNWGLWRLPLDGSAPRSIQPKGFRNALHPTEAKNRTMTFDVLKKPQPLEAVLALKYSIFD